eukprot:2679702-Lingulodinium_polyedra.AAC.1
MRVTLPGHGPARSPRPPRLRGPEPARAGKLPLPARAPRPAAGGQSAPIPWLPRLAGLALQRPGGQSPPARAPRSAAARPP